MSLPELQQNPLVQRVIDIFDTDGNGEVDFKGGWLELLLLWLVDSLSVSNLFFYLLLCRVHRGSVPV